VDVCDALVESKDAGSYWRKLKQRLKDEGSEIVTFCHGLKLPASDGKSYLTDCANTEGIFRIVQSIPSPKAEPFKRWLAKVGFERVQEIEDLRNYQMRFRKYVRENLQKVRLAFGAWGISCRLYKFELYI
jgi:DNA-damage-inducible protein D